MRVRVVPHNPAWKRDFQGEAGQIAKALGDLEVVQYHIGSTAIPGIFAKPVIDIVIYRGGDMLNAWAFTALTQGLGLGLAAVALVGAGIAACWAATGIYLGRRFNNLNDATVALEDDR